MILDHVDSASCKWFNWGFLEVMFTKASLKISSYSRFKPLPQYETGLYNIQFSSILFTPNLQAERTVEYIDNTGRYLKAISFCFEIHEVDETEYAGLQWNK